MELSLGKAFPSCLLVREDCGSLMLLSCGNEKLQPSYYDIQGL